MKTWQKIGVLVPVIVTIITGIYTIYIEKLVPEDQLCTVLGELKDTDGIPLTEIVVDIDGINATTDESGMFIIHGVSEGAKTINIHYPNPEIITRLITIPKGERIAKVTIRVPTIPENGPSCDITYPLQGSDVVRKEMVKGTSQDIPVGSMIWVILYCQDVERYYPASHPADVDVNGNWVSSVSIGSDYDSNIMYDIIVIIADQSVQDKINQYLEDCKRKNSWPGMEQLPEGALICCRITVNRV